jgi:two-component system LytT family response regulator
MSQIFVPTNKGGISIELDDIIRVEANSNYSKIYFKNGYPLTVAKVLYWFEERLPKDLFYRIHATHIVNSHFVKTKICKNKIELLNGEQVRTSRSNKTVLQMMLQKIAAA